MEPEVGEEGIDSNPVTMSATTNWSYAIHREICYALSRDRYNANDWGTSTRIIHNGGSWYAGDWNYMGLGIGKGGQCKVFASKIVDNATGGVLKIPTGYSYATGSINSVHSSDVIQRLSQYGRHTAIVLSVLERHPDGRPKKLDVIDSNFIQSGTITRHVLPMWGHELSQYRVW
ncbi:hypothetical protein KKG41_04355 [Patescibacteria group bacterium]|nr:hypothetical protein [Patescibacteria group bacterium]MBU1890004.1 hypothetical protein [Patescibacteria group bacterium]